MSFLVRLLPYESADGAENMAADETLLHSAARDGVASLRFYSWSTATVSLGYFQAAAVRLVLAGLKDLPWVRRPSGGGTLVHHHELTYCLALPADSAWHKAFSWLPRMHGIIRTALDALGVVHAAEIVTLPRSLGPVLCFLDQTPGDLLCGGAKVVGSAQRKLRRCLLQHGSILLSQSEHTPDLPGLAELTQMRLSPTTIQEAVAAAFAQDTGFTLRAGAWTEQERRSRSEFRAKFTSLAWNEKR